jgi:tetratricopeptide (TPR) repeat protein
VGQGRALPHKASSFALAFVLACIAFAQSGNPLSRAQVLVGDGKLAEALPLVRQFVNERPASPEGRALLGFILFKQSKPSEALREYSEMAKHRSPTAFEAKIIGLNHAMLNEYSSADRWLSGSLQQNPKDLQACNYLGEIKFLREKYADAAGVFRRCLNLDPKNVFAENGLGSAYEQLNQSDEAAAAYRKSIEWQAADMPQNPTPFLNLGRVLLKQNQPEEALKYLTRAVELVPEHAATHEQLGKAYSYVKELERAQTELEKASRLNPKDARLHYVLGRLYRSSGKLEKAQREFDEFRALRKNAATAPEER